MSRKKPSKLDWKTALVVILTASLLYLLVRFILEVLVVDGAEKAIYSVVLIAALFLGIAHLSLFFIRKSLERKNSPKSRLQKRSLEKTRHIINYITPIVLVILLYHFWEKGLVLITIIVGVLLLDRVNELLRMNK